MEFTTPTIFTGYEGHSLPERHRENDDEGKIVYEMSDSVVVVIVVVVVIAFQEL